MKDMKLPSQTPSDIGYISDAQSDQELFNLLSQNFADSLRFYEEVAKDDDWIFGHSDFNLRYLKWVSDLYFNNRLDEASLKRLRKVYLSHFLILKPFIHKDLTVEVGGKTLQISNWLLGSSSPYFHQLIRISNARHIKLSDADPEIAEKIIMLTQEGDQNLESETEEPLKKIIPLSRLWGLDEMADKAESYLKRYLRPENAIDNLLFARKMKWRELEKESADYYSKLNLGFGLKIDHEDVIVTFYDFKELTTLEVYKKVAPIVTTIGLRGNLTIQPEFSHVIHMTPKLTGFDFTETTDQPSLNLIPRDLKKVILKRAYWVQAHFIDELALRCPYIDTLDLEDDTWLNYETWGLLNQWKGLLKLNLKGLKQLEEDDLRLILLGLNDLQVLDLSGLKKIESRAFNNILRPLQRLQVLKLDGTLLDDSSLSGLISEHYALEEISLKKTSVTGDMIKKIKISYPRLKISF